MSSKKHRTDATSRTVDMFTGLNQLEQKVEAERMASGEDIAENREGSTETIEQAADRWRNQAFVAQEWSSKLWPKEELSTDPQQYQAQSHQKNIGTAFRLTLKNGWLYLEQMRFNRQSQSHQTSSGPHGSQVTELSKKHSQQAAGVVQEASQKKMKNTTESYAAYHYAGLMLPQEAILELVEAVVASAREYKKGLIGGNPKSSQ